MKLEQKVQTIATTANCIWIYLVSILTIYNQMIKEAHLDQTCIGITAILEYKKILATFCC